MTSLNFQEEIEKIDLLKIKRMHHSCHGKYAHCLGAYIHQTMVGFGLKKLKDCLRGFVFSRIFVEMKSLL